MRQAKKCNIIHTAEMQRGLHKLPVRATRHCICQKEIKKDIFLSKSSPWVITAFPRRGDLRNEELACLSSVA